MAFRFVHSSDWHLGKPFGRFEDSALRARLGEARHQIIDSLADLALKEKAPYVVVAGDVFDSEMPSEQVLRQSIDAMRRRRTVRWFLLPGNHDLDKPGGVWARVLAQGAKNVVVMNKPEPVEMTAGVFALPAPCSGVKDPGRDRTRWMAEAETPEDAVRIGIAHGTAREFGGEREHSAVIDADRVESARLDYLALGDWHSTVKISDRCWYSGTPEPDRIKRRPTGQCLLVEIAGAGRGPAVEEIATGQFQWREHAIDLLPDTEPAPLLEQALDDVEIPRDCIVDLRLSGRLGLSGRAAWQAALDQWGPALAHWSVDWSRVATEAEADDLDRIALGGALRAAADELHEEGLDESRSEAERAASRLALRRLYEWADKAA